MGVYHEMKKNSVTILKCQCWVKKNKLQLHYKMNKIFLFIYANSLYLDRKLHATGTISMCVTHIQKWVFTLWAKIKILILIEKWNRLDVSIIECFQSQMRLELALHDQNENTELKDTAEGTRGKRMVFGAGKRVGASGGAWDWKGVNRRLWGLDNSMERQFPQNFMCFRTAAKTFELWVIIYNYSTFLGFLRFQLVPLNRKLIEF